MRNHLPYEKDMASKHASEKFGVPKDTISTWIRNKAKLFSALQKTSSSTKKIRSSNYKELDNVVWD